MATCDTLEADLSRTDYSVTFEQQPCIEAEIVQAEITIEAVTLANQGPKGDIGPQGPPGQSITGPAGPPGNQGAPGAAATIAVGSTVTLTPGSSATVNNSGSSSAATFNFGIPAGVQGNAGATGATGPQGATGTAATIAVGSTTTGAPGTNASVTNTGTSSTAIFAFTIPRGDVGAQGPPGPAGAGTGDMLASVYDPNHDNIVDQAAAVPWTGVTGKPSTFTPSTHASTHVTGGGDVIPAPTTSATGAVPALPATAGASKFLDGTGAFNQVAYANVTGTPTVPAPSSTTPAMDGTAAVGTGTTYARNDHVHPTDTSRMAVGAAPTAHATSHKSGGSDAIALDTLAVPTDITTLNAATTQHGLLPKLSGTVTQYLTGNGTWVAVPYSSLTGTPSTFAPSAHASSHVTGGADVIALATSSARGLLTQVSGNTTDFVDGTNACQNLVTAVTPTIWSQRLRSYNAIGNPNFEVDQRNVGTQMVNPASGSLVIDRWAITKIGTMAVNTQQSPANVGGDIPGTNFRITSKYLAVTLTTQQTTLGAGDALFINQLIEGPNFRELIDDVSSVSVMVASTVAGLKFSVALRDPPTATKSLVKLCTISAANTWQLIPLANLPVFPAGNFSIVPGNACYQLCITLASGTTFTAPAADTWQNGAFVAAPGMSNFAASPVNAIFQIAVVQHEPGSQCTQLMDVPFSQNYYQCLRYFAKSYSYNVKPGTVDTNGAILVPPNPIVSFGAVYVGARFPNVMAKTPTVSSWSPATGGGGLIRDMPNNVDRTVTSTIQPNDSGFAGFNFSGVASTANPYYQFHYTADTGW
jgi:hypothetical protein